LTTSAAIVKFEPHLYRSKWHLIVNEINKRPETLDQLREMVVKPAREPEYIEDSDNERFMGCQVESDPDE
jgi:hypothetical protein